MEVKKKVAPSLFFFIISYFQAGVNRLVIELKKHSHGEHQFSECFLHNCSKSYQISFSFFDFLSLFLELSL